MKGTMSRVSSAAVAAVVAAAVFGAATAAAECPASMSQRAVKTAGTDGGYPASCRLAGCRLLGYRKSYYSNEQVCNPVTGCASVRVHHYTYQVAAGTAPANACPADVSAPTWSAGV